jgi:hypothetical protein
MRLGGWESLDMVLRYTRSVRFDKYTANCGVNVHCCGLTLCCSTMIRLSCDHSAPFLIWDGFT